LDIGTSSVRASLYDQQANPLPRASVKVTTSFRSTPEGGFEIDPDDGFSKVVSAIDSLLEKTNKLKAEIEYVAPCAFWHSLVGVDAQGRAATAVIPWTDTRSAAQAAALRRRVDEAALHARTGCRIHPTYWPARFCWFAERDRKTFRRVRR